METESTSFFLLDERIQQFIWAEGWESLRDAQEAAIPIILASDRDVIVAAATASGKTEAAFLPALTKSLQEDGRPLIIYVSPLKALINDQLGRLERLCEQLDIPVWPWHGDVGATTKKKFSSKRCGVLLITPESLEATLCSRGTSVAAMFAATTYIIIDELHAFIGSERGKQLQSLMHRIEIAVGRRVIRVGLSATLGDMTAAADFLRPGESAQVAIIDSGAAGSELKILVKGYESSAGGPLSSGDASDDDRSDLDMDDSIDVAESQEDVGNGVELNESMVAHIYQATRGTNNLIFPNSRREVERYTYLLNRLCDLQGRPREYWPHHGSLSKEIRFETEHALKRSDVPANGVCTSTMELGIDIGPVRSVVQIGPPPAVASLRQRLGRSGRRKGEPAILRGYCIEDAVTGKSPLDVKLRLKTVQMAAMVQLLLERWFEPPAANGLHLSTLVQQVLSCISQNGGASVQQLYGWLCGQRRPFPAVTKAHFAEMIRSLGGHDLVTQDSSGELLLGGKGEQFVGHHSFYAAFSADEEWRVARDGRTLGSLPVSQLLTVGQRILFAGKTWKVVSLDEAKKTIFVTRSKGGAPPMFSGGAGRVHRKVREKMRELFVSGDVPRFIDAAASAFLREGRDAFTELGLADGWLVDQGGTVSVFTWLGDDENEALVCMFQRAGLQSALAGPCIEITKGQQTTEQIVGAISGLAEVVSVEVNELLVDAENIERERWDWALPGELLKKSYASKYLNVGGATDWLKSVAAADAL